MSGATALYAGATGGSVQVVKLLIRSRVNVNQADEYGVTPLFNAAGHGHVEVIRLLLDARASANKAAQMSPAMVAEQKGHVQVMSLLGFWKIWVCIMYKLEMPGYCINQFDYAPMLVLRDLGFTSCQVYSGLILT